MNNLVNILITLTKRWTSNSPKLFVKITNISALIAVVASIALIFSASFPAWLISLLTLIIAFSSGLGINSKLTTTNTKIIKQTDKLFNKSN